MAFKPKAKPGKDAKAPGKKPKGKKSANPFAEALAKAKK